MTSTEDIIQYSTVRSLNVELVYEKNIRSLVFNVDQNSQPSGPPFSGKHCKPLFPLERWALGLGYFLSPLNTNDGFFSHIPMHIRSSDPYISSHLESSVPCEISKRN